MRRDLRDNIALFLPKMCEESFYYKKNSYTVQKNLKFARHVCK